MNTTNESIISDEFTYWKFTTAVVLTSRLLFSVPVSLHVSEGIHHNKTKSLRTPLNLIHQSLLLFNCVIVIPDVITTCIFIPVVLRYCKCEQSTSSMYFLVELLYYIYFPLNFSCHGLSQLLIIKGKRRLVTFRAVLVSIIICTVITILVATEGTAAINLARQTYVCSNVCPGYFTQTFDGLSVAFQSYAALCFFPSLFILTFCTIWSCVVFKKSYTGGNDDLNRRVISLPIILPLTLIIPTMVSPSLLAIVQRWLASSRPYDYPYWIIFTRFIAFQAYEIIARVCYPFFLLFLNPKIGHNWKSLIFDKYYRGRHNQVAAMNSSSIYNF